MQRQQQIQNTYLQNVYSPGTLYPTRISTWFGLLGVQYQPMPKKRSPGKGI